MKKPTKAQQSAIDLRGRSVLVSAAAGSGKTATLTQRIIRLLTDETSPADVCDMLIVTFTRAAAGELRTRISAAISSALAVDMQNEHLARQLAALGSAKICTIDSYYLDLARGNFERLGLPASFRPADEGEAKILRRSVMNAVIEERYSADPDFPDLCEQLTGVRSSGALADVFIDIYEDTERLTDGGDYLLRCAQKYKHGAESPFFDTVWGNAFRREMRLEAQTLAARADSALEIVANNPECAAYSDSLENSREFLKEFLRITENGSYSAVRETVRRFSPISAGRVSGKATDASRAALEERNALNKAISDWSKREFLLDDENISAAMLRSSDICEKIHSVISEYRKALSDEKALRGICDFADLSRFALKLLTDENGNPTDLALEERKKYSHIFVDEYQDTDGIQDTVFRTISNGHNLFLVGDVKQSIYGFRGAEPSIFTEYRKESPPVAEVPSGDCPCSIYMSENFRCAPCVVNFTNAVCSYLFSAAEKSGNGIGYRKEDDLVLSRPEPYGNERVKIALVEKNDEENAAYSEAIYIANEIKRLVKYEKNADGTPFKYGDMAILVRSHSKAEAIADVLVREGIPHANGAGEALFENPEVLMMFSLLCAIDNPERDVPLAGALRSPIFRFSLSDLVEIRRTRTDTSLFGSLLEYGSDENADAQLAEKCREATKTIDDWREAAQALPVHIFVRDLWRQTNALTYAGSGADSARQTPNERRRNLQQFYEYARKFEASAFRTLHDFTEYIGGIIESGEKIAFENAGDENTVRIMTVHKSKGLEFPVVFLAGTASRTNTSDGNSPLIFTPQDDLGLTLRLTDKSGFGKIETPMRLAAAKKVVSLSLEEEIRVLYVALTRARDRLYVTAEGSGDFAAKKLDAANRRASLGDVAALDACSSTLDRILTALSASPDCDCYEIEAAHCASQQEETSDVETREEPTPEGSIRADTANELSARFAFEYPLSSTRIPAKLSVSRLYPEILDPEETDLDDLLKKVASQERRVPKFMGGKGDGAAERGTATHLFLQFCDFSHLDGTEASVNDEVARLCEKRFISEASAKLIRKDEIAAFAKSEIFKSVKEARNVWREQRFNVFLPARDFTSDEKTKKLLADEKLLVQGVIDLFFTDKNGNLVLCDYKTDRLTPRELRDPDAAKQTLLERHGRQLSYYAAALGEIFTHAPDVICVYSLHSGAEYRFTVDELSKAP